MDAKLREMEEALKSKGIEWWQIFLSSTYSCGTKPASCGYEIKFDWASKKERNHEFSTFDELYDYVMNLPAKNPILYRQFSLAA